MATQVDPLRSTLDHLALDPRARSDRPYLITMLRRLGYSEAEIALYLGEAQPEPEPQPGPEPEPAPREPLPESGERVIEIEYTGPGLRPFQLVVPMSEEEAALDDPLGLGAGLEAGSMTIEGDPDEDELASFLEGEGAVSLDEEFAGDDAEFEAESDRDNEDIAVREEDDLFGDEDSGDQDSVDEDSGDGEKLSEDAGFDRSDDESFGEELGELEGDGLEGEGPDAEGDGAPFDDAPPLVKGKKAVQFTSVPLRDATVRRLDRDRLDEDAGEASEGWSEEGAGEADGWTEVPDPLPEGFDQDDATAWSEEGESWQDADLGAYWYHDWLLHSREEETEDGTHQRVYFFAKGESPNGTPATMPDGYEVATNRETGLPYLRPVGQESEDPAAADAPKGRKRVRMRRVQAESQEEAEEALRGEGRNVLGSMPVDIQQSEDEEA